MTEFPNRLKPGRESAWSRFLRRVTRDYGRPRGHAQSGEVPGGNMTPACAEAGHHVVRVLVPGRKETAGYYCRECAVTVPEEGEQR